MTFSPFGEEVDCTPIGVYCNKERSVTEISSAEISVTLISNKIHMRYETYEQEQARLKNEYEEFLQGKWHYQYSFKLNCEYCGREFYSKNRRRKYCCYRCVNDNYIQKRKERKQLEKNRVCVICNKHFVAKKKDAMYCSNACKQKAYRLKKKDVTD